MEYIRVAHEQPGLKIAADAVLSHLKQINTKLELPSTAWAMPTPALASMLEQHSPYFSRLAQALLDSKLGLQMSPIYAGQSTKSRLRDCHTAETSIPAKLAGSLTQQGILWVGQLADPSGRYIQRQLLFQKKLAGLVFTEQQAEDITKALVHPSFQGPRGKLVNKHIISPLQANNFLKVY